MAHGDYNCCAVCDCKRAYSDDAATKAEICMDCLRALHAYGVMVYESEELLAWMRDDALTPERRKQILDSCGLAHCHYPNDIDDAYKELLSSIAD